MVVMVTGSPVCRNLCQTSTQKRPYAQLGSVELHDQCCGLCAAWRLVGGVVHGGKYLGNRDVRRAQILMIMVMMMKIWSW